MVYIGLYLKIRNKLLCSAVARREKIKWALLCRSKAGKNKTGVALP
jgi:hypothetical protein